jgi:hypothetical protein
MEAIEDAANISKTECGHTFHFQCLYRWNRDHTNCPLCRNEFGTFEQEPQYGIGTMGVDLQSMTGRFLLGGVGGYGRTTVTDLLTSMQGRTIDAGEADSRDVDLIMRQVENVTRELVEESLQHHHGDIVDTIMYLVEQKGMPIPPFQLRDRGELPEPYVSRDIRERSQLVRKNTIDVGYDSC